MTSTLWKPLDFLKIATLVGIVTALVLLSFTLHAAWPATTLVAGAEGRGVKASLESNTFLQQEIVAPAEFANALFVALDTSKRARDIQASLSTTNTTDKLKLGRGYPVTLTANERENPGGAWRLPQPLEPNTTYIVQLSLAPNTAQSVELIANERSQSSSDATMLHRDDGVTQRQNFALTISFAAQQSQWAKATPQEREEYIQTAGAIVAGTAIILALTALSTLTSKRLPKTGMIVPVTLGLATIGAIGVRLWFASHLPLVNDEQFYIYDALLYNPRDPQFWKAPLLITVLAGWVSVVGVESLLAIRLVVILTSVTALSLLALIAYHLSGRLTAYATLAVAFFMPTVASYTSLIMTEQFMLIFVVAAVLLALIARQKERPPWWQLLSISVLTGLAAAVRWSGLFWLLAVAILIRHRSFQEFSRRLFWLAVPYAVGTGLFLMFFPDILPKLQIGGLFVEFFERSKSAGWITKLLSWREPLARVSPLMLLGLIALNSNSQKRKAAYVAATATFMLLFFPAWQETPSLPDYPIFASSFFYLAAAFTAAGIGVAGHCKPRTLLDAAVLLVPPLMAYAIFHKVNPKYLAESMPALVLLAGLGLGAIVQAMWQRRSATAAACLLVFVWLVFPWVSHPLNHPYAGTISLSALTRAVEYLRAHVGGNERVLTASSLIPLMASKEPAYPISHPSWIEPIFREKPDPRYKAFWDPVADDVEKSNVQWVVDEKLTTDTYRRHPRIDAAISSLYETVMEIDNENFGPITILKLKP